MASAAVRVSSMTASATTSVMWPWSWHAMSSMRPFSAFSMILRSLGVPYAKHRPAARAPSRVVSSDSSCSFTAPTMTTTCSGGACSR